MITRQNRNPVVMISLEDFHAIEEILYLVKILTMQKNSLIHRERRLFTNEAWDTIDIGRRPTKH
jgi:hypothetical protein